MTEAVVAATHAAGSSTGLELHVGDPGGRMIRDHLDAVPALAGFYGGHPRDIARYRSKADEVRRRMPPALRARVAAAYRPTSKAAARKLERVLAGDGVVVTTGQQPGLMGGPLYTVYKILSAVKLAENLENTLGQPVLAVFWVGSHDHDWAEVNHIDAIDGSNRLRRIEIAGEAEPPFAMYARRLGDAGPAAVAELAALLPSSEFASDLVERLRNAYAPDKSMASAFADLLHGLLEGFDLAIFDPAHESVWPAAAPVIAYELASTSKHTALLQAQTERLERAGYPSQVTIAEDAANIFLHDENGRDRLMREANGWALRRSKRVLSDAEIDELVQVRPESFSPNVLLRPIVESSLIPTVAYVGGPAEASYFAQIGCLFLEHGIEPPVVVPRRSVTVVEGKVRKVLDKFSLEPSDFARPFHEVSTAVIHGELPASVTESIRLLRAAVETRYEALVDGAATIDPTLRGWMTSNRNTILGQLEAAEKKVTSHLKKRSDVELDQLRKAAVNLFPDGTPQERVLNPVPFIARYGPGFLDDVARAMTFPFDESVPGWNGVECD